VRINKLFRNHLLGSFLKSKVVYYDLMNPIEIISVTEENVDKYGFLCITNKKYPGYQAKRKWLYDRFQEGLIIRLLLLNGKAQGYIEAIPGEYAWRPIDAPGYLVIHCLYSKSKKFRNSGNASQLLTNIIEYAREKEMSGVAVITSEGSWLAGKSLFLKHKFKEIAHHDRFDLLVHAFRSGPLPKLKINEKLLPKYTGLHLLYSAQCPYHINVVPELEAVAKECGADLNLHEITSAEESQLAPSLYGTFMLIFDGKIYADHYISKTRFRNILTKELGFYQQVG